MTLQKTSKNRTIFLFDETSSKIFYLTLKSIGKLLGNVNYKLKRSDELMSHLFRHLTTEQKIYQYPIDYESFYTLRLTGTNT